MMPSSQSETDIHLIEREFTLGNRKQVLKRAEQLCAKNPEDSSVHMRTGRMYLLNNDIGNAMKFLNQSIQIDSENTAAWFLTGYCYEKSGDLNQAREIYIQCIKTDETFAPAHAQLAMIYSREGRLEKAMQSINRSLYLQPDSRYTLRIRNKIVARIKRIQSLLEPEISGEKKFVENFSDESPSGPSKEDEKELFYELEHSESQSSDLLLISEQKKDKYRYLGIPLLLLFLLWGGVIMYRITAIRVMELRQSLANSVIGGDGRSAELIARYKFIQRRFGSRADTENDLIDEARMAVIQSGEFQQDGNRNEGIPVIDNQAIEIINGMNRLAGVGPVSLKNDKGQKILELGYFCERKRQYRNAEKIYTAALEYYRNDTETINYIKLHRGFSRSLSGNPGGALKDYEAVMISDKGGEKALTAEILASFLRGIGKKISKIDEEPDSVGKGVRYFKMMDYMKAVALFNRLEPSNPGSQKLLFYRGRALEESGDLKNAINDYKKTIKLNPDTQSARDANRRLFMLGAFYGAGDEIRNDAVKRAPTLGDQKLLKKTVSMQSAVIPLSPQTWYADKPMRDAIEYVNDKSKTQVIPVPVVSKPNDLTLADKSRLNPDKKIKIRKNQSNVVPSGTPEELNYQNLIKKKNAERIFTNDGLVFVGVISAESEKGLTIYTIIGPFKIDKNNIAMRSLVRKKIAIK